MGFVPLTIFFMAFLLSFQENVMGKPAVAGMEVSVPEECKEELKFKNYCTNRPYDYPSDENLRQLYYDNLNSLDFRVETNETKDREGENICGRPNTYFVENIYVIRDVRGDIRYTLHIPGVFEMIIPATDCYLDADDMPHARYKAKNIKCEQKTFQYPFLVLSHDQKHLESVKILGLNSACVPVQNKK